MRRDPNQPNLRQVHLIHAEVFDEARAMAHSWGRGDLGENVLTADLDLLGLPTDEPAPSTASPECATAPVIRKAGVMAVVERGGEVVPGQPITLSLPDTPRVPLAPV